ncbi:MAG: peptidase M2 family protein [Alphaproteobacteria bacterium]|nr:peptidase M2 family protein [Alphaproteobacteria bacterium]
MTLTPLRRAARALAGASLAALAAAACRGPATSADTSAAPAAPTQAATDAAAPTAADAAAFIAAAEKTYAEKAEEAARIAWVNATNITFDTDWLAAKNGGEMTKLAVDFANEAKTYDGVDVAPDIRRKLNILKQAITLPAPSEPGAADTLAQLTTRLGSAYSTGKIDLSGGAFSADDLKAALAKIRNPNGDNPDADISNPVVSQNETELLMRQLRNPAELAEVWTKWRDVTTRKNADGASMKDDFVQMVALANKGAKELGYADVGAMWRSGYDMPPDEFAGEVDRLWGQVRPLYEQLHCYVRAELNKKYGDEVVPLDQPIRADLLGNMWAQEWGSIGDIVSAPGADGPAVDLDARLAAKGYTPLKMVQAGENFFSSLGFAPLPATFWERSQITKPRDREVVCHASAWDLDSKDDIRIKMCATVSAEDFVTIHHELGHNYYQRAYKDQPFLFQAGANDGFHEAIGDMVALSITPDYLQKIGLIDAAPPPSADIALLLRQALDKVAFLPFGLLVDKWRWEVFSGEVTPDRYNDAWWALRTQYQGVRPPGPRPADGFDAGAKYHVANSVPYMRYFLARILQFQFYKAACDQIGWKGPLHRCSFYGSKEVGEKFEKMLEMGASKPWPDALEEFTGSRQMDGAAMVEYFRPLMEYLKQQNKDRQCGW